VIHSHTDYVPSRLAAQAEMALALHSAGGAGRTAPPSGPASATLSGCVRLVTGGSGAYLVDLARYQGHPAIVIMQAGQRGRVWVVAPSCPAGGSHLITYAPLPGSG
jgi:hypothetical protein